MSRTLLSIACHEYAIAAILYLAFLVRQWRFFAVAGRILVVPDGRILWIRDQGVQQPVAFYCHKDERAYEVVFTRVNRDSALGYVVMPAFPAEKAAAVSQGSLSGAGELAAGSIPARTAVQ